jgi:hypothetical protein
MISTNVHVVTKITVSEARKLATGNYSRTFTVYNDRGETYELTVYAKTASALFPVSEEIE